MGASRTPLRVTLTPALAAAAALVCWSAWSQPAQAAMLRVGMRQPAPAAMMRVGIRQPAPAEATVAGRLPAQARLRVTVTLKPRHPAALAAYARAVSTPGNASFRRYLRPAQFGRRFGASPAQIALVRRALDAHGLHPGPASAGHLSIPLSATAAALDRGLSISLLKLSLPGRRTAVAANLAPSMEAGPARLVQAIVGLDSQAPRPLMIRPSPGFRRAVRAPPSSPAVTSGPQPCAQARGQAGNASAYTADRIASAYGFSGLYAAGDDGSGVTVAVYELEPDNPADIAAYQACYRTSASVNYVPVDGGVGSGAGSGEAALDIENLIGLAPDATVLVYQGPNSNSGAPGSGPYDTFSAIVNQDRARVISVSWGECEAALGAGSAAAENTLFEQAAVQGQSIVAAAGDGGSEDCDTGGALPQTQLAVDDPSSQPYVIGVGGTTLSSLGSPPVESVWNSGGTVSAGLFRPGAGAAAPPSFWPMPASQLHAAPSLNVLGARRHRLAMRPTRRLLPREVPDVSADADPSTGYLIYWNGGHASLGSRPAGRRSAARARRRRCGRRCWPWPTRPAACAGALSGSPGRPCTAPRAALRERLQRRPQRQQRLHRHQCGTVHRWPRIRRGERPWHPERGIDGGQPVRRHAADRQSGIEALDRRAPGVSLRLSTSDSPGIAVRLQATGLPPGLSLNPVTGTISGRPLRTGIFGVSVTAQDRAGASASIAFGWTIGAAPQVSHLSVSGLGQDRARLGFTLTAGRRSPGVRPAAREAAERPVAGLGPRRQAARPDGPAATIQRPTRGWSVEHHAATTARPVAPHPRLSGPLASTTGAGRKSATAAGVRRSSACGSSTRPPARLWCGRVSRPGHRANQRETGGASV